MKPVKTPALEAAARDLDAIEFIWHRATSGRFGSGFSAGQDFERRRMMRFASVFSSLDASPEVVRILSGLSHESETLRDELNEQKKASVRHEIAAMQAQARVDEARRQNAELRARLRRLAQKRQ